MIRVSEEARGLLGAVRAPEGEVLRLVLRQPRAGGPGGLALRHGCGEGADQVVQHAGGQVLRIDLPVRKAFDGASVEVVDGALSVVLPGSPSADDGSPVDAVRPSGSRIAARRPPQDEGGRHPGRAAAGGGGTPGRQRQEGLRPGGRRVRAGASEGGC